MNKKVLSAILFSALFAGTGTFTSCIDNDEPAGIENLRGAKAELIRAKVAVEAANAAYVQAQAQLVLAQAKTEEAKARWEEANAACKEAEAELEAAQTAEQKALLEKQIAAYKNQMAEAALKHEATILDLKATLAQSQQTYDATLAAIEAAKLTLTEEEQAVLTKAEQAMKTAATAVNTAYDAYVEAQGDVNSKMTTKAKVTLAQLENELAYVQAKLNSAEFTVVKAEEQLALAEKFDAEAWNAQIADLKEQKQALNASLDSADVELQKVHVGDEYQAAEDAYALAVETLGANEFTKGAVSSDKKSYVKGCIGEEIVNGGTQTIGETEELTLASKKFLAKDSLNKALDGTLTDENGNKLTAFALEAYESSAINPSLMQFIEKSTELKGMISLNDENESVFAYDRALYTEGGYKAQLEYLSKDAEYEAVGGAMKVTQTLEGWIAELNKFSTDKNGEAWAGIEVEKLKAALEDTKAAYVADSTAWDIMLKAYKGTATTAPTNVAEWTDDKLNADVDAAVTAYNAAVVAAGTAVTDYNTAIDAVKTATEAVYNAAKDASVTKQKTDYANKIYIESVLGWLKSTPAPYSWANAAALEFESLDNEKQTVANLELIIDKNCAIADGDAVKTKLATLSATATLAATDHFQEDRLNGAGKDELTYKADGTTESKANNKNDYYEDMMAAAAAAGDAAVSADEDETIAAAKEAITKAETGKAAVMEAAIDDVKDAYDALVDAMNYYNQMLAADYGQVLVGKNLTKIGTTEIGKATYVAANGDIDWANVINKDLVIGNTVVSDTKNADNTDKVYAGFQYKTLAVSDITADEKANLVLAALNEDDDVIKAALKVKSERAFGDLAWDANANEYRAIAPTREEVEAGTVAKANCGSFGELLIAEDNIALYEGMATAGESVQPIIDELTAQLTAVEAEIAANSAIVAAYKTKFDAAEAAYEAGEDAIEAAEDAREAVCAEAEALVLEFAEKVSYVELLINTAQAQLDAMYNGDSSNKPINAEEVVAYWKEQVALAEKNLATQQDAVIAAEMAIEQYNAGTYTEELQYKQAILKLETATAAYEAALEVYNQRLAELQAVIEALAK